MKHKYISNRISVFIAAVALCLPLSGFSQVTVTAGGTPSQIISSMLGAGLTVSNVQLNCGPDDPVNGAYGTFNGSASNIGVQNGVILTTGFATNAIGPNNATSQTGSSGNDVTDPDLTTIDP